MSSPNAGIRSELHELIDTIADTNVLLAVRTLLASQWHAKMPPLAPSAAEQDAIDEGIRQLNAGECVPHEQVMAAARAKYGVS